MSHPQCTAHIPSHSSPQIRTKPSHDNPTVDVPYLHAQPHFYFVVLKCSELQLTLKRDTRDVKDVKSVRAISVMVGLLAPPPQVEGGCFNWAKSVSTFSFKGLSFMFGLAAWKWFVRLYNPHLFPVRWDHLATGCKNVNTCVFSIHPYVPAAQVTSA